MNGLERKGRGQRTGEGESTNLRSQLRSESQSPMPLSPAGDRAKGRISRGEGNPLLLGPGAWGAGKEGTNYEATRDRAEVDAAVAVGGAGVGAAQGSVRETGGVARAAARLAQAGLGGWRGVA